MATGFAPTQQDADCPVPLGLLGDLYRADPATLAVLLEALPEDRRCQLALFCYGKAHLRPLALTIAATCDAKRLGHLAGALGSVLAAQCRAKIRPFSDDAPGFRAKPTITLAKMRA